MLSEGTVGAVVSIVIDEVTPAFDVFPKESTA
jgi:hypothetical protein